MEGQHIARFTKGSLWRHVTVMSLTNATGMVMVFLADFVDIFFIAQLGVAELAAGVGFAGTVLFFVRSLAVAMGIATSVLVSRYLGMNDRDGAARMATNTPLLALLIIACTSAVVFIWRNTLLGWVGATGTTLDYAANYLAIVIPGTLMMTLGMCGGQIIRAMGEAKQAMWIPIAAGLVNVAFDPLFIFTFGWGLEGAAWATVLSQATMMLLTWWIIIFRHRMVTHSSVREWIDGVRPTLEIAVPSMLTSLAAPVSTAFVSRMMAQFGDSAIAAFAVVMRLVPVSLAVVFALSSAVAPIVGQNAGAGQFDRVRQTLNVAFKFNWLVVAIVTVILFCLRHILPELFSLSGDAAALMVFFCSGMTLLFGFDGMVFFLNATFNNLGRPLYSTLVNFGRVFLGVVPMVYIGQHFWGANGVLLGFMAECVLVSFISWFVATHLIARYQRGELMLGRQRRRDQRRVVALWPFTKRWPS